MAKGRQAAKAARRREREALEALEAAQGELREAHEARREAEAKARTNDALRERVRLLEEQLAEETSTKVEALEDNNQHLRQLLQDQNDRVEKIRRDWDKVVSKVLDRMGGGHEAAEALVKMLDGYDGDLFITENPDLPGSSVEVEKARRARAGKHGNRRAIEEVRQMVEEE